MFKTLLLRVLFLSLTAVGSAASAADVTVFSTDFNSGAPPEFSGVTTTEGVQGYAGLGTGLNVFDGDFLRNTSAPPLKTTLTLTGLPPHSSISLGFLLAIIDSWDGSRCFAGPDSFNVSVDGSPVFSEVFENSTCGTQSFVPPPGVLLARRQNLGFNQTTTVFLDSAYDMGLDPVFQNIPHTASTLTIEWFAGGPVWQGGDDESWAIDNVEVILTDNVTVFATGLEYPRGLKFGPDGGYLYVAEAGSGGTMSTDGICDQVIPPVGPYMGGFTSRISRVAQDGTVTTVADHLPSGVNALGDVLGIADVTFIGHTLYALSSGGGCSHGFANDDAAILRVNSDGTTRSIADLSVFQKTHPVKNPNPLDFEPDGSWYSMIAFGNLLLAVEPNHGELDLIHTDGRIRRIADISASQGHIVPTAVAFDGVNFYVGNLGTFPIVDGSEVILKITPSGEVRTFATGFTTILGLTFDSHGKLYVLENTTGGNQFPTPGTGKILRLSSDGTQTEIATGLNLPTAMTFGPDGNLYVSSWGFGPPGMGEIDKVKVP